MIITSACWTTVRVPYARTIATAHGTVPVREAVLLKITADDGTVGLGEGAPVAGFGGGTIDETRQAVAAATKALVGSEIASVDPAALAPQSAPARAAIDIAILDLQARLAGTTVSALLGGTVRTVPVNALVGDADTAQAAATARTAVDAGFRCIKLKVGMLGSLDAEIARIRAVRDAIGPLPRLRLDANEAWTEDEASTVLIAVEPCDLELVEQPVARTNLAAMARIRRSIFVALAADEAVSTLEDAETITRLGAAQVLVVKPILAGGLRPGQAIIHHARSTGIRAFVTTTIDCGIGTAAALHLATTLPQPSLACGLATGHLLESDLLTRRLVGQNGTLSLPDGPGLGVVLDDAAVRYYGDGWQHS